MRVFISSVISGFENFRDAAAEAARSLDHEVLRAEDFSASPRSPRVACLNAVRAADMVLVLLGERYGQEQASGKSATHEEFEEATREKQPFAFIQSGITPEPRQAELIAEAQDWAGGHYTSNFRDAGELRTKVVQALNRWQLENAAGRVNSDEMRERALVGLPEERRGSSSYRPSIAVSVVGHPRQSIIRPSELEDPALHRQIKQQALFGDPNIFNDGEANEIVLEGHALALKQGARSLTINEDGSVRLVLPLPPVEGMLSPIIEEDVTDTLLRAFRFVAQLLQRIDATERVSSIAVAVSLVEHGNGEWRTRAKHARQPNSTQMSRMFEDSPIRETLSPAHRSRAAFRQQPEVMAEDFTALLRRAFRRQ